MPKRDDLKKVMVVGSGPIVIGQAAEFDYAGTQACKALREEGISVVLINSNPATIMTDVEVADKVYIEPINVEFATRVIERERPDGLLPTLGGQTGLNLAVELANAGVLEKYNVELLGTPLDSIMHAEDRELFRSLMRDIGEPVPESWIVQTREELRADHRLQPAVAADRPARVYSRRDRRRRRARPRRAYGDRLARAQALAQEPGYDRAEPAGLERDRVRSDARRQRHLHHHLLDGKLRPDGRAHRAIR